MYLSLTPNGGTEFVIVNGAPYRPWVLASQDWGNPKWEHEFSGSRGTQGARPAQGRLPNRTVRLALRLYGQSVSDRDARISELATVMGQLRRHGGLVTRRATGSIYRQHMRVLTTPGDELPEWDKASDLRWTAAPILEFTCAPYAEGDPMAWLQTFTKAADVERLSVAFGSPIQLHPTLADGFRTTTNARTIVLDELRRYRYGDVRLEVEAADSTSHVIEDYANGVVLRYLDPDNWVAVNVEQTGATSAILAIRARIGGTESVLASTSLGATVAFNHRVLAYIVGNVIVGEFRTQRSSPYNEHQPSTATVTATLTPTQAAAVGRTGRVGLYVDRQAGLGDTSRRWREWSCQPYYYPGQGRPTIGNVPLGGPIPGDAPALTEVAVTTPAANTVNATWCLIGWAPRESNRNLVWNGHLDEDADGWSAAAVAGITAAATSVGSTTTATVYGVAGGEVVTTAADTSGTTFRMWDTFRKGNTYRAKVWVQNVSGTSPVEVALGVSGDLSVSAPVSLGPTLQELTVDWTPTTERTNAYLAIRTDGTAAPTLRFDAARVWDTTMGDPVIPSQMFGFGGYSPCQVIAAVGHEQETGTTDTVVASMVGTVERATVSGAGSLGISYIVDPALTTPDDYTEDELELEVWARVNLDNDLVGVRGTAWVNPAEAAWNADTLGARRAAHQWGVTGRPITRPITGDAWRLVRLGVVPVHIDRDNPTPVRLTVSFTWTGGADNLDLDYIAVVPYRSRCLAPTAVSYTGGGYPDFVSTNADEVTKTVRPDLSAVITAPPSRTRYPDHGLGGSLLELPPGDVDLLVLLSDLVPDDPDAVASSNAASISAAIAVSPTPRWSHLRDA